MKHLSMVYRSANKVLLAIIAAYEILVTTWVFITAYIMIGTQTKAADFAGSYSAANFLGNDWSVLIQRGSILVFIFLMLNIIVLIDKRTKKKAIEMYQYKMITYGVILMIILPMTYAIATGLLDMVIAVR